MNSQRNQGRRRARDHYYARHDRNHEDVAYFDATVGPLERTATAAAMTEDGRSHISASISTALTDVAEGDALAIAVAHHNRNMQRFSKCIPVFPIRTDEDHSLNHVEKPGDGIHTYHQITTHYRKGRRELPPPHPSLTRPPSKFTLAPDPNKHFLSPIWHIYGTLPPQSARHHVPNA
ncbi:hypothetical protein HPB50_013135 [Hyalomma asiaticum]|uniref:Uncharacterized protein n=1 Tax=Hyalomma asiaticum TaxID=266040 RepID=A0ACB7SQ88_HYAAI|nr:hypothetical protein HPB50_013135 [Hyalomma asiaticum]